MLEGVASVVAQAALRRLDALSRRFLFADTRDTLVRAASAAVMSSSPSSPSSPLHGKASAVYAVLRAGAQRGGNEFWLDVCLLVAALLVVVNVTVGLMYCAYVTCIGLPREARMADAMRNGTADYQQKRKQQKHAQQEPSNKATKAAAAPSVAEDMALLSQTMTTYKKTKATANAANKDDGSNNAAAADAAAAAPTRRRGAAAVCTAVLRGTGTADVHLLLASPAQKYVLVGTRGKRKTTVLYAQADVLPTSASASSRRGGGDGAGDAATPMSVLTSVQEAMTTAGVARDATNAEVYSAAFSVDDARLVVGERSCDVFLVFAVSGGGGDGATRPATTTTTRVVALTMLRAFRLPDRRLVSSLPPQWRVLGESADALVCLHDKECEVEVLTPAGGGGGAVAVASAARHKFRVGHAVAWAQHDAHIAVAGSFLRQPRLGNLVQRGGSGNAYQLETTYTFSDTGSHTVLAMALVQRGAPAFNTRNYLVVVTDDGAGCVYNLDSLATRNTAEVVCRFADTDYASDSNSGDSSTTTRLHLLTAVHGKAYTERLTVALVRDTRATVLRQSGSANASDGAFVLQRVADLHDVQGGASVRTAALLCGGDVLATCGAQDGRGVRLFAVPASM